ncbi:DUF1343 domain-containing protein [bacterium]|nr:DUF1343 domain-containing protein [bacterium]
MIKHVQQFQGLKAGFPFSLLLSVFLLFLSGCSSVNINPGGETPNETFTLPTVEREFRAAWVATVANINWPSRPGLPVEEQKREAAALLDMLEENHFNAVIFQVRPQCDALYKSGIEPWSYYLTGSQGKPPEPFYDPLVFWIEESHKRGLELHVWLNPYRAHHPDGGAISDHSIVTTRPDLTLKLKNGYYWMDPAKQGTQDHSLGVVMDIVERYDIDGVHFDDYFYPYPSYNGGEDFPDSVSWNLYRSKGGTLSRGDWRREHVNTFIRRVYTSIKRTKPHVMFGLSPFGIWRPNYPESIRGLDQYDQLFADARRWLNNGWIDYWSPQLYWPVNQIPQSYPVLLGWWSRENTHHRHIWPGINVGRFDGEQGVDEILNQIMITRGMLPGNPGNVHWSIGSLLGNEQMLPSLLSGPYRQQALVPSSPWIDRKKPGMPQASVSSGKDSLALSWRRKGTDDAHHWIVYLKYGDTSRYRILTRQDSTLTVPLFVLKERYARPGAGAEGKKAEDVLDPITGAAVSAVDRAGNESEPAFMPVPAISFTQAPPVEPLLPKQANGGSDATVFPVKPGIDVLVEERLDLIRGKRIGLITNPSAVGADLRSDIDILTDIPDVNLVALFGTEHGILGARQGRISQKDVPDSLAGIPVYSLYDGSYAPEPELLERIDVLLFDIQGVGSAWYTFKYFMSFAMEACARAGIPFIVLDRPNPLGGEIVEGPILHLGGIFRHPLPLRHGMTYGELALMWNETEHFGADVQVIKMKGWRRSMTWDDTGLHWVMPSPNMGTLETALVYPGQCLFERTNMSEGRGTTKPFLMVGAPWVDSKRAVDDLNGRNLAGALFRPVHFIPEMYAPGANIRRKPWNRVCHGVEIILTDYKAYRSVEAALHIIDAFFKTNPDSLNWSPPEILKRLEEPEMTVNMIVDACGKEVESFAGIRKKYLMYK